MINRREFFMLRKCRIIKEIFLKHNKGNNKQLIIYTKAFNVIGEFFSENEIRGIITLKNARVYTYTTNCECETNPVAKEIPWFNIFGIDIVGFSFIEEITS